jgi:hypothetical protein
MGRAARLKTNPDRDRYQNARRLAGTYGTYECSQADRVRAIAYHEAGHVVAAHALGFGLTSSTVRVAGGTYDGDTDVLLSPLLGGSQASEEETVAAALTPDALRKRAMQALAGRLGEELVHHYEPDLNHGSQSDLKEAVQIAQQALGLTSAAQMEEVTAWPKIEKYLGDCELAMRAVLKPRRPDVIRVATHLIDHVNEQVPGDTLKALMQE